MAKRKSINKRLSRYGKLSTGSAILDPDTVNLGYEESYWWRNLEDNSNVRPSTGSGITNQTSRCLNDTSHFETSNGKDDWWKPLKKYDVSGTLPIPTSNVEKAGKAHDAEHLISESDEELPIKKKKRTLRGSTRKSRDNAFSKVLSNTKESISEPLTVNNREALVASKNSNTQSSKNRQDSTVETSMSESDEQLKVKRQKRTLRTVPKKSRENAFLKVLASTRESSPTSLSMNLRDTSIASKHSSVQLSKNQQDSTDESTIHVLKAKPRIFRKRIPSSSDVSDDVSKELANDTPSKRKSSRIPSNVTTENLTTNKCGKRTSIISQAPTNRNNLSLGHVGDYLQLDMPKAQSTVLEDSESSMNSTQKEVDKNESVAQILKSRPIFLKRNMKRVRHNSFEDILMNETVEDKSRSSKLINTGGSITAGKSRKESQIGDKIETSMTLGRNASHDKSRYSTRTGTVKLPSMENKDISTRRRTRSIGKSNNLIEKSDVPDDMPDSRPDRSNMSESKSRYLKNANKNSNRTTSGKSFRKSGGNPIEQGQDESQLDDPANTSIASRNNVSINKSRDNTSSKTAKSASIAKNDISTRRTTRSTGKSNNLIQESDVPDHLPDLSPDRSNMSESKSRYLKNANKNSNRTTSGKSFRKSGGNLIEQDQDKSQLDDPANISIDSRNNVSINKSRDNTPSKTAKSASIAKNDISTRRTTRSIGKSNNLIQESDVPDHLPDSSPDRSNMSKSKSRYLKNANKNSNRTTSGKSFGKSGGNLVEQDQDESQLNDPANTSIDSRNNVSVNKSTDDTPSETGKLVCITKTGTPIKQVNKSIGRSSSVFKAIYNSDESDSSSDNSEIFYIKSRSTLNVDKNAEQKRSTSLSVNVDNKEEDNRNKSQLNNTANSSIISRNIVNKNKSKGDTQSKIVQSPSMEKNDVSPRRVTRSIRKSNNLVEENDVYVELSDLSSDSSNIFHPKSRLSQDAAKNAEVGNKEEHIRNKSQLNNTANSSVISRNSINKNKSKGDTQSKIVKSPSMEKNDVSPRRVTRSIRESNNLVEENDVSVEVSDISFDSSNIFTPKSRLSQDAGKNAKVGNKEEHIRNKSQLNNTANSSVISRNSINKNESKGDTQSKIVKSPSMEKNDVSPRRVTRSIRESNNLVEENDVSVEVSDISFDSSNIFTPKSRLLQDAGKNAKVGNKEEHIRNKSQLNNTANSSVISRNSINKNESKDDTQSKIVKSPSMEENDVSPRRVTRSIRKSNNLVEENDVSAEVSDSGSDRSTFSESKSRYLKNVSSNSRRKIGSKLLGRGAENMSEEDHNESDIDERASTILSQHNVSHNLSNVEKLPSMDGNDTSPKRTTRSIGKSNYLDKVNTVSEDAPDSSPDKSKSRYLKNASNNSRRKIGSKLLGRSAENMSEEDHNESEIDDVASTTILSQHNVSHNLSNVEKLPSMDGNDTSPKRTTRSIGKSNYLDKVNTVSVDAPDSSPDKSKSRYLKNASNNSRRKIGSKLLGRSAENMSEEDHNESEIDDVASTTILSEHNVSHNVSNVEKSPSMEKSDSSPKRTTRSIRKSNSLSKENDVITSRTSRNVRKSNILVEEDEVSDDLSDSHYNRTDASDSKARYSKNQRKGAEEMLLPTALKRSKISGPRSSKVFGDRSKQNTPSIESSDTAMDAVIINRRLTVESEVDSDALLLRFSPFPDETDQGGSASGNLKTSKTHADHNIKTVTMQNENSRLRSNVSLPKDRVKSSDHFAEVANDSRNTSEMKSADDHQRHRRKTRNRKTSENVVSNADAENEMQDQELHPAPSNELASHLRDKNTERSNRMSSRRNDDKIISSNPIQSSTERSQNNFSREIENISENQSLELNSPSRRTSSSIGVSSISFITTPKEDMLKKRFSTIPKSHVADTPSIPIQRKENVEDPSRQTFTQQKIDKFFQMYKPGFISQASVVDPAIEAVKKQLEEVKKKEMIAMKLNAEIRERNEKLHRKNKAKKLGGGTNKKKQPARQIDKAFLVNGAVYKVPRLPRPKPWVTDRLYRHLWKHMEVKYEMETRVRSEKFVKQLSELMSFILKQKTYRSYEMELNALMMEMARLNIIRTRNDFYSFCREFLPYEIREKIIPTVLPGNLQTIPHDTSTLNKPLLRSS